MSNTNTGGPAFPGNQYANGIQPTGFCQGMTMRDYFAAKAMQGYLIAPDCGLDFDEIATASYKMADAMLRAREAT